MNIIVAGWHALSLRRACSMLAEEPRPSKTQGVPPKLRSLEQKEKNECAFSITPA